MSQATGNLTNQGQKDINHLTNQGQKDINHEKLDQKQDEITTVDKKISSIKRPANSKTYVILKKRFKPDIFDQ